MEGPFDGLLDINITGHNVSGFFLFATNFLADFGAISPSRDNPFATYSYIVGLMAFAAEVVAANVVPRYPLENEAVGGCCMGHIRCHIGESAPVRHPESLG